MRYIFILLIGIFLNADEKNIELISLSYTMENDAVVDTDNGYTHGANINTLFKISNNILDISYLSFSYNQQMFTPYDLSQTDIIEDDRPYAGYEYIGVDLHRVKRNSLNSLMIQIGNIGPASMMQELQNKIHDSLDVHHANGWDNQIKDKLVYQLNYIHKWRIVNPKIYALESVFIPYTGVNLGTASIKATIGAQYRIGFNIPRDFGVGTMNEGGYVSIPRYKNLSKPIESNWSFCLNLSAGSNLVYRDIFLDDWYDIERNNINVYGSYGVTLRYRKFSIDYALNYYTKEYEQRGLYKPYKGYGTIILTYNYE